VVRLDAILAHPDIAHLARSLRESPGQPLAVEPPAREAAIAVVLRLGTDGEPELLMIKRAEVDRDPWSGHVACPGGRREPADRDLETTAKRETWEETGIDLATNGRIRTEGRILGVLNDVMPRTPVLPPILIRPFVAVVPPDVEITPSPEVAAAFWVPLSALRERAAWSARLVTVRGTPREEATFSHGEHVVWGLTERILRQLVGRMGSG
jgi:8-oxo-dGTP pyrophosphatase MutT (NUDIX family)